MQKAETNISSTNAIKDKLDEELISKHMGDAKDGIVHKTLNKFRLPGMIGRMGLRSKMLLDPSNLLVANNAAEKMGLGEDLLGSNGSNGSNGINTALGGMMAPMLIANSGKEYAKNIANAKKREAIAHNNGRLSNADRFDVIAKGMGAVGKFGMAGMAANALATPFGLNSEIMDSIANHTAMANPALLAAKGAGALTSASIGGADGVGTEMLGFDPATMAMLAAGMYGGKMLKKLSSKTTMNSKGNNSKLPIFMNRVPATEREMKRSLRPTIMGQMNQIDPKTLKQEDSIIIQLLTTIADHTSTLSDISDTLDNGFEAKDKIAGNKTSNWVNDNLSVNSRGTADQYDHTKNLNKFDKFLLGFERFGNNLDSINPFTNLSLSLKGQSGTELFRENNKNNVYMDPLAPEKEMGRKLGTTTKSIQMLHKSAGDILNANETYEGKMLALTAQLVEINREHLFHILKSSAGEKDINLESLRTAHEEKAQAEGMLRTNTGFESIDSFFNGGKVVDGKFVPNSGGVGGASNVAAETIKGIDGLLGKIPILGGLYSTASNAVKMGTGLVGSVKNSEGGMFSSIWDTLKESAFENQIDDRVKDDVQLRKDLGISTKDNGTLMTDYLGGYFPQDMEQSLNYLEEITFHTKGMNEFLTGQTYIKERASLEFDQVSGTKMTKQEQLERNASALDELDEMTRANGQQGFMAAVGTGLLSATGIIGSAQDEVDGIYERRYKHINDIRRELVGEEEDSAVNVEFTSSTAEDMIKEANGLKDNIGKEANPDATGKVEDLLKGQESSITVQANNDNYISAIGGLITANIESSNNIVNQLKLNNEDSVNSVNNTEYNRNTEINTRNIHEIFSNLSGKPIKPIKPIKPDTQNTPNTKLLTSTKDIFEETPAAYNGGYTGGQSGTEIDIGLTELIDPLGKKEPDGIAAVVGPGEYVIPKKIVDKMGNKKSINAQSGDSDFIINNFPQVEYSKKESKIFDPMEQDSIFTAAGKADAMDRKKEIEDDNKRDEERNDTLDDILDAIKSKDSRFGRNQRVRKGAKVSSGFDIMDLITGAGLIGGGILFLKNAVKKLAFGLIKGALGWLGLDWIYDKVSGFFGGGEGSEGGSEGSSSIMGEIAEFVIGGAVVGAGVKGIKKGFGAAKDGIKNKMSKNPMQDAADANKKANADKKIKNGKDGKPKTSSTKSYASDGSDGNKVKDPITNKPDVPKKRGGLMGLWDKTKNLASKIPGAKQAKALFKVAKKLPILGAPLAIASSVYNLANGNIKDGVSDLVSIIPFVGLPASLAIDAIGNSSSGSSKDDIDKKKGKGRATKGGSLKKILGGAVVATAITAAASSSSPSTSENVENLYNKIDNSNQKDYQSMASSDNKYRQSLEETKKQNHINTQETIKENEKLELENIKLKDNQVKHEKDMAEIKELLASMIDSNLAIATQLNNGTQVNTAIAYNTAAALNQKDHNKFKEFKYKFKDQTK